MQLAIQHYREFSIVLENLVVTQHIPKVGDYTQIHSKMVLRKSYSISGVWRWRLWRARRLVVDTGIHAKSGHVKRSKLYRCTPNAESDAVKMVERHVFWVKRHKIGMLLNVNYIKKNKRQH
jgi:hypothetical protein